MLQTIRVFFSAVWFLASGGILAYGLGFLITWEAGYGWLFLLSIIAWAVSTGLVVALSAIE